MSFMRVIRVNRLQEADSRQISEEVIVIIQISLNGGLILVVIVEERGSGWISDVFVKQS